MPVERQAQDLVQADANWIDALARPSAYPLQWGVTSVEVIQTHASVVFLAGDYALKVKKAVDFGFLDYSSLHKRIACCEAEVRQNRRMAQEIYLGVVAVVAGESGWRFACESAWQPSDGAPAADIREVAVWMRKMDLAQNLANILQKISTWKV